MALSDVAKEGLRRALTEDTVADEIETAINAGANDQSAAVDTIIPTENLEGVDGSLEQNAAPLVGTENRLDAIEAKIDAVLTALKDANIMAT